MHSPACSGRKLRHLCNTSLVSTGRQCLPKILPQFLMLHSSQKAARDFICSNLCCSFATDRRETDCRCNSRWTLSPASGNQVLLPFLSPNIISDTRFKLPTSPCTMSFGYEKNPKPSMKHHDTGRHPRYEILGLMKEGK